MFKLDFCKIKLKFHKPLGKYVSSTGLRSAIANIFPEDTLFHHHVEHDRLIYRYPLIQYKVIEGNALIIGLLKGAVLLGDKNFLKRTLCLGNNDYIVDQQETTFKTADFGLSDKPVVYRWITPWYALNSGNYDKYLRMGNKNKRNILLGNILTGNLISMSKGLEYTISGRVQSKILETVEVSIVVKNYNAIAFKGLFESNFIIPELCGLGKSVSRGFGAVQKVS